MPAMKMTAKKSTGGVAPRVVLTMPHQDSSTIAVQGMDVCNDGSEHNNVSIGPFIEILISTDQN